MASTIHHLSVGQLYYEKYLKEYTEDEKERFLLGTIAVDWNSAEKKIKGVPQVTRKISHFITNEPKGNQLSFEHYIPNLERFIEGQHSNLDDPFVLGYLIHLITDKLWFENLIPIFVNRHLKEINDKAQSMDELTNEEYLNWYRNNFYHDFDIHNLIIGAIVFGENCPCFTEADLSNLPVYGLDTNLLQKFLEITQERLTAIEKTSTKEILTELLKSEDKLLVADLYTISNFINECVEYCNQIIIELQSQKKNTTKK